MKILIDSPILLDIFTEDPTWFEWSSQKIAHHAEKDILLINPIIYSELSLHFSKIEDLDEALPTADFLRENIPWEAAFLAARAFQTHHPRSTSKQPTLPPILIGAHAALTGLTLLTRDPHRFRDYYPKINLIHPKR